MAEQDDAGAAGAGPAPLGNVPDGGAGRMPVDWAEVRRAYEETGLPTRQIEARFGITRGQLRWRQQKDRWKLRPRALSAGAATRLRGDSSRRLRMRLLGVLDGLLGDLEQQIAAAGFDAARARALAALTASWADLQGASASKRRSGQTGGAGMTFHKADNAAARSGAALNKKKNNEPGWGAGRPGDDCGGSDDSARLSAELKSRLDRLRMAQEPGRGD